MTKPTRTDLIDWFSAFGAPIDKFTWSEVHGMPARVEWRADGYHGCVCNVTARGRVAVGDVLCVFSAKDARVQAGLRGWRQVPAPPEWMRSLTATSPPTKRFADQITVAGASNYEPPMVWLAARGTANVAVTTRVVLKPELFEIISTDMATLLDSGFDVPRREPTALDVIESSAIFHLRDDVDQWFAELAGYGAHSRSWAAARRRLTVNWPYTGGQPWLHTSPSGRR